MKKLALSMALLLTTLSPTWAGWRTVGVSGGWHGGGYGYHGGGYGYHGGGWGYRGWGGYRGGVSVNVGGPWWPYDYPYGYYDPYYYPGPVIVDPAYDPGVPYPAQSYGAETAAQTTAPVAPDTSHHDLRAINDRAAQLRALYKYKLADGDISNDDNDAGLRFIAAVQQEAKTEAAANGGYLTGDQQAHLLRQLESASPGAGSYPEVVPTPAAAPSTPAAPSASHGTSGGDISETNDLLLELRTLLQEKQKEGAITKPQADAEAAYLDQLDKRAHNGTLTESQQNDIVHQLHRAYYAINHNLIVH